MARKRRRHHRRRRHHGHHHARRRKNPTMGELVPALVGLGMGGLITFFYLQTVTTNFTKGLNAAPTTS